MVRPPLLHAMAGLNALSPHCLYDSEKGGQRQHLCLTAAPPLPALRHPWMTLLKPLRLEIPLACNVVWANGIVNPLMPLQTMTLQLAACIASEIVNYAQCGYGPLMLCYHLLQKSYDTYEKHIAGMRKHMAGWQSPHMENLLAATQSDSVQISHIYERWPP